MNNNYIKETLSCGKYYYYYYWEISRVWCWSWELEPHKRLFCDHSWVKSCVAVVLGLGQPVSVHTKWWRWGQTHFPFLISNQARSAGEEWVSIGDLHRRNNGARVLRISMFSADSNIIIIIDLSIVVVSDNNKSNGNGWWSLQLKLWAWFGALDCWLGFRNLAGWLVRITTVVRSNYR